MDEKDTSLLKALLEFILKINITNIIINNNELHLENVHLKKLVDILVYSGQGVFNIEVNTTIDI